MFEYMDGIVDAVEEIGQAAVSVKSADRQKHRRAAMKKQSGIFLQARA